MRLNNLNKSTRDSAKTLGCVQMNCVVHC
uniref:Uncharacterized protein n=1 Tax=Anguilla anguilla TaxID=7936 RepID=A0A0E9RD11_ANGAN